MIRKDVWTAYRLAGSRQIRISEYIGTEAYILYISPTVKTNYKGVYMALECKDSSERGFRFLNYKFFSDGEDYRDNYH